MIVIEWADEVENRDLEKVQNASKVFLPRITALINSKVNKLIMNDEIIYGEDINWGKYGKGYCSLSYLSGLSH